MEKVFSKEKLFATIIGNWMEHYSWIKEFDKKEFDVNSIMEEFIDPDWCINYSLTEEAIGPDATFSKEKYIVQRLHDFIALFDKDCWINKIDGKTKKEIKDMKFTVPSRGFVGSTLSKKQGVENGN